MVGQEVLVLAPDTGTAGLVDRDGIIEKILSDGRVVVAVDGKYEMVSSGEELLAKENSVSPKWEKQITSTYEKYSSYRNSAPKEKIRKVVEIYKPSYATGGKYVVSAEAYRTRVIGIQGEEGLIGVLKNKSYSYKTYSRATKKAEELKKLLENEDYNSIK